MRIRPGCLVGLDYVLRLEDGELLDASSPEAPLTYVHGAGHVPARLESALEGLRPGDRCQLLLPPGVGLGESDVAADGPLAGRTLRLEVTVREVRPGPEAAEAPPP